MKFLVPALVLAATFFAGPAQACNGKSTILEDSFADDTGGWESDPVMKFENGAMAVTPTATGTVFRELNAGFLAKELDFCVDTVWPDKIDNAPAFGLIFWAPDYRNHFLAQIDTKKQASLHRYTNEVWAMIWRGDVASIKNGPGEANNLRVVAKDNLITFYVNGEKVKATKAQMPKLESRFGVYLQRGKGVEGQVFRFKNFKATMPE